jgi:DNA-binding NarL/FixJ family response regulator
MLTILLVEDNTALRRAMKIGLEATRAVQVLAEFASGEDVLASSFPGPPGAVLMDVCLAGEMNGIRASVALRREYPRLPIVFYSIQDDEEYYRDFLRSGILSHYAYVRKSNYLLPESIVPLLREAAAGRSFIDPEIEARVQAVRHKDANDPLDLLEPNEQAAWGLNDSTTDEKVARTRAALIYQRGELILWNADGQPQVCGPDGKWRAL